MLAHFRRQWLFLTTHHLPLCRKRASMLVFDSGDCFPSTPPPPPWKMSKHARFRWRWLFLTTATVHCHRKRASELVFDGSGGCPPPPPSTAVENEHDCS